MSDAILSFLGLALRGRRLVVGEEPVALAARAGESRLILLAADAAANTLRRGEHLAEEGHCMMLSLPSSKAELGGALGRGSAAILAVTDTGFAAALVRKLADRDPERYDDAAARMERKLQRAKERKEAPPREKKRAAPPREKPWVRPGPRAESPRTDGKFRSGGRSSGRTEERRGRPGKGASGRRPASDRHGFGGRPGSGSRPGSGGKRPGSGKKAPPGTRGRGGGR